METTLLLPTLDGQQLRTLTFQVANVIKALGSVSQMEKAGNRVVFDSDGGFVQSKDTGEKLWLEEEDGVYILPLMVGPPKELDRYKDEMRKGQHKGFHRQGR